MRSEFPDGYVHDLSDEAIAEARAKVPALLLSGLDAYVRDRIPVGSFLMAVLQNDLVDAFSRAEMFSETALPDLVRYLNWCLPSPCYGSPEKVKAWLAD